MLGLLQIDDVDTVALHKNIWGHVGVPLACEVTKMDACFEKFLCVGDLSHGCWGLRSLKTTSR